MDHITGVKVGEATCNVGSLVATAMVRKAIERDLTSRPALYLVLMEPDALR